MLKRLYGRSPSKKAEPVTASTSSDFENYVGARWGTLVRSVVLMGSAPEEAEDAVQTALAKCYRHWRRVTRADNPDAYVQRVVLNTLRSQKRRRWTGERPSADLPEPVLSAPAGDVESRLDVTSALMRLGIDQRTAVVLRYYSDMSERDIAFITGVAPGTVKSRLARGLHLLAEDPSLQESRGRK